MPPDRHHEQRRRAERGGPLRAYLLGVGAAGILPLLAVLAQAPETISEMRLELWLLAAFVVAGELLPIRIPGREDEVTTSAPFMYALLLSGGLLVAAPVQGVASVVADVRARKSWLAIAFNAGQFTLALMAAAAVLASTGHRPEGTDALAIPLSGLPGLALAGAAFFAVNNFLAGTAAALAQGARIVPFLLDDLRYQGWMAASVVGLAPLVAAVAAAAAWLIPLLTVPLVAMHRGSRAARLSEHRALHDALTGLPNRTRFRQQAQAALHAAVRDGRQVSILVLDLDRFKEVNDALGHHHGDLLLREVGPRLEGAIRDGDLVARFGGDEFAVLLPDVAGGAGPDGAQTFARRLNDAFAAPFGVDGMKLDVGVSIGVVSGPEHGADVDTLLQRADVAMYQAKSESLGWATYDPERDGNGGERLALAGELREALERGELVLHYQPQLDLRTGRVFGAEALMRWEHPVRGRVPPDVFIPLAEHTGLMRQLTRQAMRSAFAQSAAWRRQGLDITMSVNVSARDLLDLEFATDAEGLMIEHGVSPSSIEIEITESVLMVDPRRAEQTLQRLRSRGIRIAVDDFGTGYSSLAYLKRLSVDTLKIDRSFVMGMGADLNDQAIVASTIELARSLGLVTIAEGVEDRAALQKLEAMGCDIAQGFGLSRPVPADEAAAWMHARSAPGPALLPTA